MSERKPTGKVKQSLAPQPVAGKSAHWNPDPQAAPQPLPKGSCHSKTESARHATSDCFFFLSDLLVLLFLKWIFTYQVLVYTQSWYPSDKHLPVYSCNWWRPSSIRQLKCTLNCRHLQSALESIGWFMCFLISLFLCKIYIFCITKPNYKVIMVL